MPSRLYGIYMKAENKTLKIGQIIMSNSYTKIINTLNRNGPMTYSEIERATGYTSVAARIAEFNRYYDDIEILSIDTKPKKFFVKVIKSIKLKYNNIYPDCKVGNYKLRKKKSNG